MHTSLIEDDSGRIWSIQYNDEDDIDEVLALIHIERHVESNHNNNRTECGIRVSDGYCVMITTIKCV